jgi:phage terminase small subunit
MKERKLTPKQDAFVLAYLETGNASEAYRRAYDVGNMQPLTISTRGRELLKNSLITARIDEVRNESFNKAAIDRAGVLSLLTEIATADANELMQVQVRCCRHCWGVAFKYQWKNAAEFGFKLAEALDATAREHRAWEKDRELGSQRPAPDPVPVPTDEGGYGFDVYASPNPECPRCLGEGHVMPVVKDTRKLKGAAKRLYAGFKQTKDGIEIKIQDQAQARAILAKEFKIGQDAPSAAPVVNVGVGINAHGAENVTVIATDPQEAARQYQELMKG